jgi:hypothetical protein
MMQINEKSEYKVVISGDGCLTGTKYNNSASTSAGVGLDTRNFDEIYVVVNCGSGVTSGGCTAAMYFSDVDASNDASMTICGTAITLLDSRPFTFYAMCKGKGRYFFLKTVNSTSTLPIAASALLTAADRPPTTKTYSDSVDVNY